VRSTNFFSDRELSCRCGCGFLPSSRLVDLLHAMRYIINKPLIITSGARCNNHNRLVGGAVSSSHTRGNAVDIRFTNAEEAREIEHTANLVGFKRVARGKSFIHVDIEDTSPYSWFY